MLQIHRNVLGRLPGIARAEGRRCVCNAKRGRPRSSETVEAASPEPIQEVSAEPKRRGRPKKAEQPAAAQQSAVSSRAGRAEQHPDHSVADHERVISYESDITSSIELDYTDDASIIVPSYTHQAQGHDSNTQPPLEASYLPDIAAAGFVGEEALSDIQQQLDAAADAAAAAAAAAEHQQQQQQLVPMLQQQQQLGSRRADGPGVLLPTGEAAADEEEEEDLFPGSEEPPGVFDYEAGLTQSVTLPEPEQQLQYFPDKLKPKSRREADYMLRWLNWVGAMERQRKQFEYEETARKYLARQNKESHNHYLNAKAMAIVTAEIELEDHESGNRWDSFYPVWARAEHRWYPTGRFAAYNDYVRDNIGDLTMKLAPGADQEEDFDIMDDVFLMADDPGSLGMDGPAAAAAAAAAAAGSGGLELAGPAAGLSLDSFLTGVLPGAASSDLGASYLDEVLAPEEEQLEEEE